MEQKIQLILKLPTPSPTVIFIPFRSGGVLFHQEIQRIWVLNHSLSYIWCALPEFDTQQALISHLSETFQQPEQSISEDLQNVLSHLEAEGLLKGSKPSQPDLIEAPSLLSPRGPALPKHLDISTSSINKHQDQGLESLTTTLVFSNSLALKATFDNTEIQHQFENTFKPFVADPDGIEPHLHLAVISAAGNKGNDIYINKKLLIGQQPKNSILPTLYSAISEAVTKSLKHKIVFHAAVVTKNNKAIILPAESGSGKSTLTAALVTEGWEYFSDELAVYDPHNESLQPHLLPLSIKSGSVKALKPFIAGIEKLTEHTRLDGKKVRYLPLEAPASNEATVDKIIFPQYQEKAETKLEKLPKEIALKRLAITGSSERTTTIDDIRTMIKLVEHTDCCELIFSNLDQALTQIRTMT